MKFLGSIRRRVFGISPAETTISKRGFQVDHPAIVERLESVGRFFVLGYHEAMIDPKPEAIGQRLDAVEDLYRGFAYEGAGMALTLLDILTPWNRKRFDNFLAGAGDGHLYMVHVGAGWALARLARRIEPHLERYVPIWRPLVIDGYGFHEGYFKGTPYYRDHIRPKKLQGGYGYRAFDQGLGRACWFVCGTNVARVHDTISGFAPERHGDLWGGVGLAATYAGGVDEGTLLTLRDAAGDHAAWLGQGAAFAAKARQRAANPVPHVEVACRILCSRGVHEAAALTDSILADLDFHDSNAYETWRTRLRDAFVPVPI